MITVNLSLTAEMRKQMGMGELPAGSRRMEERMKGTLSDLPHQTKELKNHPFIE